MEGSSQKTTSDRICTVPRKSFGPLITASMARRVPKLLASYCTFGSYSFKWTPDHLPRELTDPLRYQYDELGAETLARLQEFGKKSSAQESSPSTSGQTNTRPTLDLLGLLREHHNEDDTLSKFWSQVHTVPDWVDWAQIERGQKFFYRYAAANIMGFALQGFVGENSAASGVVEVLVRTGGFSTRVLLHRLLETFQFLLQVTQDLESIKPGGAGFNTTIRVRLLHSSVRQRIMKLVERRPEYFDVQKFGVPVNTLDSIHSITTFACNHMWLQLPMMGVYPTQQEIDDYIALFRYVAYLIGTPQEYFNTSTKAKAVMESMLIHELKMTPTSKIVGYNFVKCLEDLPPFNVSASFIEAGSRMLNSADMCDALDFGYPGWYSYACFQGHCWLVATLARLQKLSPWFDGVVTNGWKNLLHSAVIQAGLKGGSKLEFKYVPKDGSLTGKEDNDRKPATGLIARPVEAFYFTIFVLGCLIMLTATVLGLKIAHALFSSHISIGWVIPQSISTSLKSIA